MKTYIVNCMGIIVSIVLFILNIITLPVLVFAVWFGLNNLTLRHKDHKVEAGLKSIEKKEFRVSPDNTASRFIGRV